GGRRRDHDQIRLARETDMPDLGLVLEVEQIGEGAFLGEHGKRERRNELGAAFVKEGAHRRAPLLQPAHELEALISGDAAADDQEDALALHVCLSSCRLLVIPAKAGIQGAKRKTERLDPGFRRDDAWCDVSHKTTAGTSPAMTIIW